MPTHPRVNRRDLTLTNLRAGKVKLAGLNTALALTRQRLSRLEAQVREIDRRLGDSMPGSSGQIT